jgi:TetR/AcrR family transcriptional regulator
MPKKKPAPIEADARERILSAAGQVFAESGFAGARIDDIAERAGINKAMLYYHVGDKERLYTAVLTSTVERGLSSLGEASASGATPSEKLQNILHTLANFGTSNPIFIPIMLREIASGGKTLPDEMLARMGGIFRIVAEVLAEGISKGVFRKADPLLTHVSLVGSLIFLVASTPVRERLAKAQGITVSGQTAEELARHVGNLFLHGLEIDS